MTIRLVSFAIAMFLAAQAWAFTGTVQRVHDGDTVTVDDVRVRLYGIDAPELDQPGGKEARQYLASLAQDRAVEVLPRDVDAYGRTVGVLLLLPGRQDLNAAMVKAGHAWVYKQYCRDCTALTISETWARLQGLGLWAKEGPVAPWVWRNKHRRTP
ncbi:thermonuclease family protein [Fundidesulfovibrio terrae]|uniref:thermonuclease family protein n=1 Tax=Fundidesulfovibrio terrae TaxID=2922866 RepID=UPI001FAF1627|nr:thermonuclease family protein [Fundidesulfovibrio terrae]